MKIAVALNKSGRDHVEAKLSEFGLNWSLDGTLTDIEGKDGFMSMQPNGSYEYEISNRAAGKSGYGVAHYIEITSDMIDFEVVE